MPRRHTPHHRTAWEYQPFHKLFLRRNNDMKTGLVHNKVFHRGHLSKRRIEGRTGGLFILATLARVLFASFFRAQ